MLSEARVGGDRWGESDGGLGEPGEPGGVWRKDGPGHSEMH